MLGNKYCPSCGMDLESFTDICKYCGTHSRKKKVSFQSKLIEVSGRGRIGYCLLCVGVPLSFIFLYGLIMRYVISDPYEVIRNMELAYYITFTLSIISFCLIPGIILTYKESKKKSLGNS
ncbi:MAG: hypothetical protein ACXABO_08275 [Promethearchaeota archaeon]|jgi:hypothetical protein